MALLLSDLVAGTAGLKASEGFGRLDPSGLAVLGYAVAFYVLAPSLEFFLQMYEAPCGRPRGIGSLFESF
jgi:multidrug transporter EmrE-like cation transporter